MAIITPASPPWNDIEQVQRIAGELIPAVDNRIANTAADNYAEHAVEKKIINLLGVNRRISALAATFCQPPGEQEGHDVHQAVPANFEWSERKYDRIDLGVYQHEILSVIELRYVS
jgi:hypothetical protein